MIKLTINRKQIDDMFAEINSKVLGIESLASPTVLQEIAKATFAITGKQFVKAVDRYAALNPKKMHHVYEWGKVGRVRSRLFVIERTRILGGDLQVSSKFLTSKVPVPVPSELKLPGKTGKFVSSRSIFRNKATVMESGKPVTFQAKKILAFMGSNGPVFVAPGTIIHIGSPGGKGTKNAFSEFMVRWYTTNTNSVMDASGFYEKMVENVSITLSKQNAGIAAVRRTVAALADKASGGKSVI
jgi:hypothetical protein